MVGWPLPAVVTIGAASMVTVGVHVMASWKHRSRPSATTATRSDTSSVTAASASQTRQTAPRPTVSRMTTAVSRWFCPPPSRPWCCMRRPTTGVTCKKKWLHNYVSIKSEVRNLILGDNFKCHIHSYGTICMTVHVNGRPHKIAFAKVLYTPDLAKNLISTAHIATRGNKVRIHGQGCDVIDHSGSCRATCSCCPSSP